MGSLWGPWVPLVTILGSLWDLVGVPWVSNGGFGGTLVRLVPPFFIPLTPFGILGLAVGTSWASFGLCWGTLGLKWQLWQDHTDEKKLPKLYI